MLAACAINSAIFPPEDRPFSTIPAILLVLALLPTHYLASMFGSLSVGVAIAWTITGIAGYAWIARYWQNFRFKLGSERTRKLVIAILSTYPIVFPTILLNFHDEIYFNQHHAIIAHLQNGTYPPRYLYEPTLPLRYHYGFDLAAAIITGVLRVRPDHAIDILTLALWPCMFLLLWRVGNHFGGRRAGLFVALAICFAGGWPALCTGYPEWAREGGSITAQLIGYCDVGGQTINPPFISNFFQHPWSIGMPIFGLVVLQSAAIPQLGDKRLGLAMMACSLSALSLCQAVLFVTSAAALGISEAWRLVRHRDRTAAWILFVVGISLIGAKLAGGFFAPGLFSPTGTLFSTGLVWRDISGLDTATQIRWNFASFGGFPILGAIGIFRARRDRLVLVALAVLPFLVVNLLQYQYSWDIIKFGTVGLISLAVGAGIALSDMLDGAQTLARKIGVATIVILLLGQGIMYPLMSVFAYKESAPMIWPYFSRSYPIDQDDARAISFLRTAMAAGEIVFRTEEKSGAYAIWGGLPTQNSVYPSRTRDDDDVYGLGRVKFLARKDLSIVSATWLIGYQPSALSGSWRTRKTSPSTISWRLRRPSAS